MLKFYLPKMFFLFTVILSNVVFCLAAEPTVSVSISPGSTTVKVKGANDAEEIGKNTAKYTISASCDPSSLETEEVKPVDPSWICSCSEITFVPPAGVQPEPPSPGNPNISALEGTNSWTTKASAPYAGQWKLKFTASVTYYVWDKKKEEYVLNEDGSKATFGPFSGTGTCDFIATNKPWKVELSTENIVVRRATNPQQQTVPCKKVTAKLIDADTQKTVIFSSNGVGEIRFGMSANAKDVWNTTQQSLTTTISKDGTKEFYISGEKESTNMNDTSIVAFSNDFNPECVGSINMTVLWVIITLRTNGNISDNNEKREFIGTFYANESEKYQLSKHRFNLLDGILFGNAIEIAGKIKPEDFSNKIRIERDVKSFARTFWDDSLKQIKSIITNININDLFDIIGPNDVVNNIGQYDEREFKSAQKGEAPGNDMLPDDEWSDFESK
jgi:hypothetical protein